MKYKLVTFLAQRGKEKLYISHFFSAAEFSKDSVTKEMQEIKTKTRSDFVAVHGIWDIENELLNQF